MMEWLDRLKKLLYDSTLDTAAKYWPPMCGCTAPSYNLRYEHVKHVEKAALKLQRIYGGDLETVLACVWSHDITKHVPGNHAATGADWVRENLAGLGFPPEKVETVADAVAAHSGWEKRGLTGIEARILWDSDKLAHFGPAYFMDLVFLASSRAKCEEDGRPDIVSFHETISMDNFLVRFKDFENEVDLHAFDRTFYFEESIRLLNKYRGAMREFYLSLKDQLT